MEIAVFTSACSSIRSVRLGLAALAVCASAGAGFAQMESPIRGDENNIVLLSVTGDENRLYIKQDYRPVAASQAEANRIEVRIDGFGNGGGDGLWRGGSERLGGLMPGRLLQSGAGNQLGLTVQGNDNLFAFAQSGHMNQIEARINGFSNQMAVNQTGNGNHAALSQTGSRNMIVVSQSSY